VPELAAKELLPIQEEGWLWISHSKSSLLLLIPAMLPSLYLLGVIMSIIRLSSFNPRSDLSVIDQVGYSYAPIPILWR
jgi:hypothetical protein